MVGKLTKKVEKETRAAEKGWSACAEFRSCGARALTDQHRNDNDNIYEATAHTYAYTTH
jgi:hypothetical protein